MLKARPHLQFFLLTAEERRTTVKIYMTGIRARDTEPKPEGRYEKGSECSTGNQVKSGFTFLGGKSKCLWDPAHKHFNNTTCSYSMARCLAGFLASRSDQAM